MKRQAAESVIENKQSMVAALMGNSLYAENPKERQEAIDNLEERCNDAIQVIYNGISEAQIEEEELKNNPFMKASKRSLDEMGAPDIANLDEIRDNVSSDFDEGDYEVDQR